jgi:hypothetical protein
MRPPQTLELSEQQRAELEDLRDHSPLPYLRERAAALLKIADGMPPPFGGPIRLVTTAR